MIYPDNFEEKTGFDRIRSLVADGCLSPMGIERTAGIAFLTSEKSVRNAVSATYEFQELLRFEDNFPSEHYYQVSACLEKIRIPGSFPEVREVFDLKRSLETVRSIIGFFKKKDENKYQTLRTICGNVKVFPYVIDASDRILDRTGSIKDNASQKLREIRSEIAARTILASKRLNTILKEARSLGIVDADTPASIRNGRGVIPVNAFDKRKVKGIIHDQSASGKTVFIEPEEIVSINNEIVELEYEERREIVRILTAFADDIRPYIGDLLVSNEFLGEIDFIRAKALLGNRLGSIMPVITGNPGLMWRKAFHPLLVISFSKTPGRKVIPLDIGLDERNRIILISGPNAGGKSVCLKTVGLLQYMLQCGFTIPVGEGSESGIFRDIFIDIGDEQSIENDLSTYSSHLINMKYFLRHSSSSTLVLIDEFGTGTEPVLGGSIAEAILGDLNSKGIFGVLTTHYTNLKHFASLTEGIVNGAMLFDNHLMQPLFQLSIGKPGSSFAFEIARKIGLPEDILGAASEKAGVRNVNYDRHLRDIARDKRYWENKRQSIRQYEKHLEELIAGYEKEISGAKDIRKEIISKAKEEARALLEKSNRMIENTIRQIKESQAEKERTKDARQQLQEFKDNIEEEVKYEVPAVEQKMERLIRKTAKVKPKLPKEENKTVLQEEKPLTAGDAVRMTETMAAGEIVRTDGKTAQVETGSMRFFVPVGKLERISRAELAKSLRSSKPVVETDSAVRDRKLSFKPEIDIRGVRGEEAVNLVRIFIDDALMVQHRHLRILHGKGNGILRQLVREYLSTLNVVKSFRDENVESGGSGITVVEMDI